MNTLCHPLALYNPFKIFLLTLASHPSSISLLNSLYNPLALFDPFEDIFFIKSLSRSRSIDRIVDIAYPFEDNVFIKNLSHITHTEYDGHVELSCVF